MNTPPTDKDTFDAIWETAGDLAYLDGYLSTLQHVPLNTSGRLHAARKRMREWIEAQIDAPEDSEP